MTPADRLEAERFAHVVREWKPPAAPRDYLDLLAIADAHARTRDEQERHSA
jgi:hypothetical protein